MMKIEMANYLEIWPTIDCDGAIGPPEITQQRSLRDGLS